MNTITQRLFTSPPAGGRFLPFDEDTLSQGVVSNQAFFQDVVDLDNGPRDHDPRPGHLHVTYNQDEAAGGKPYRLEAIYTGQAWNGEMDTQRSYHTEDPNEVTLLEDTHWHIAGGRVENATVYYRAGDSQPASANRVVTDPANPQLSGATRWTAADLRELF